MNYASLNTRFLSGFVLSRMIRRSYTTDFIKRKCFFFIFVNRQGAFKTVRVEFLLKQFGLLSAFNLRSTRNISEIDLF